MIFVNSKKKLQNQNSHCGSKQNRIDNNGENNGGNFKNSKTEK